MTIINLNLYPDAVLTLSDGQKVSLDGREFTADVATTPAYGTEIFFTSDDSRPDLYESLLVHSDPTAEYGDYIIHVRDKDTNYAKLSPTRMHQILITNNYIIA